MIDPYTEMYEVADTMRHNLKDYLDEIGEAVERDSENSIIQVDNIYGDNTATFIKGSTMVKCYLGGQSLSNPLWGGAWTITSENTLTEAYQKAFLNAVSAMVENDNASAKEVRDLAES